MSFFPGAFGARRIVCLTEEFTEILYLLGEEQRIVGISGFTVRPPRARKEKPKVSAFTSAKIDKILELKPDLVLGFSDLQADIAAQLIRVGVTVAIFNQRSIDEIYDTIYRTGALVGAAQKAEVLIAQLRQGVEQIRKAARCLPHRPRVFFEEWPEPNISAIRWVSELIAIAGGDDCFAELSQAPDARSRIIADPLEIVRRAPEIIIGSWCGRKFSADQVRQRPGWEEVPAVRNQQLFEIKSPDILQPGPAALTDGLCQLHAIIAAWSRQQ